VTTAPANDEAIRALLTRIARPHASGGQVVERATLLAEGSEFPAIVAWITSHAGIGEAAVGAAPRKGLHGAQMGSSRIGEPTKPQRYVLPAGTLT
jgi:hypothetical protein